VSVDPDEEHRLREAFRSTVEPVRAATGCPPDSEIWEAAHGGRDPERTRALLEHVAACPACQESWRAAREIGLEAGSGMQEAPARAVVRRPRLLVGIGLALAASLAALLFIAPLRDAPGPASGARGAEGTRIESLSDEQLPLPRDAAILRWTGGPPGTLYTVEVTLEDLTEVVREEELEVAELPLPPAVLADLAPGTVLLWRVEAFLPDASRVSSPLFRNVLE
jgi:hypothetical protein